jgi:hypothetical protein
MSEPLTENRPKPDECDSCHFETRALVKYDDRIAGLRDPSKTTAWLCALCAETLAGNAYRYPDQYRESGNVMRTVCYVGNVILEALKSR